jgi:hypothetical protein
VTSKAWLCTQCEEGLSVVKSGNPSVFSQER